MARATRRSIVVARSLLVALALTAALVSMVGPTPATAATPRSPAAAGTTTTVDLSECGGAVPKPNCGQKPQSPTDPGGWAQFLLLGIVMVGMAAIFVVIARSTARNTKARNAAAHDTVGHDT